MYDVFGNFDSVEEINAAAAGLLEEGDQEHIRQLAKENGIPDFFAEEFIAGHMSKLTDSMNAAIGKIEIEAAEYKNNQIPVEPIADYLKSQCDKESFAVAVRRRTKNIKDCMKQIEEKCKEIQRTQKRHWVADMTVFKWAKDYFMEGE